MANSQDPKNPCSREEVFSAISTEREYQQRRWGYRQPDGKFVEPSHGVCDFLTYMRHYLNKADEAAATKAGYEAASEELRKVVTLGIACFELNGIKPRDLSAGVINGRDGKPA